MKNKSILMKIDVIISVLMPFNLSLSADTCWLYNYRDEIIESGEKALPSQAKTKFKVCHYARNFGSIKYDINGERPMPPTLQKMSHKDRTLSLQCFQASIFNIFKKTVNQMHYSVQ